VLFSVEGVQSVTQVGLQLGDYPVGVLGVTLRREDQRKIVIITIFSARGQMGEGPVASIALRATHVLCESPARNHASIPALI
jgi:hypothetical protein